MTHCDMHYPNGHKRASPGFGWVGAGGRAVKKIWIRHVWSEESQQNDLDIGKV